MTDANRDETRGDAPVGPVTLTTGRIAGDAGEALAAALGTADVAVERRAFLPARADETPPWGALLLAVAGPPLPLARLVSPTTAPQASPPRSSPRWGSGRTPTTPATLQLKAEGMFVVVRVRDRSDLTRALDGLPAQVARLAVRGAVRGAERRLVYEARAWQINP